MHAVLHESSPYTLFSFPGVLMSTGRLCAGLAILLTLTATSLTAQQADTTTVKGIVLDGLTGRPLPGVLVSVQAFDWAVVSEEDGRFVLPRVPVGKTSLEFTQLGYSDFVLTPNVMPGMAAVRVELQPQPVVLDGIKVMADRFKRRRNATPMSVQAYDSRALRFTPYGILDFLQYKALVRLTPCGPGAMDIHCIWWRGRIIQPRVVLDEIPMFAGLDMLEGMPSSMVYLVEVYQQGHQIRVYTNRYMERVGRRPLGLVPLWW
ncbi:MAG: carboxypeptidase regulatory-like domain-containing protein [Gemmatimonadota bacterium]